MKEELVFDTSGYEIKKCTIQNNTIVYRAFEGIVYCENPVDEIQKMNLFAPEEYYQGKEINGYDLKTAPIFLPNSVGGYMSGASEFPEANKEGKENSIFAALAHGYVVASVGVRGRDTAGGRGKAPAFVIDMKAGIRYLRKNKEWIPGNTDRMITSGTSAGGALSALVGASGNHGDYDYYLKEMGAAAESDAVFASNCYCPIHNLEHADMAYEWQFCGCNEFHGMKIEKTPEGMKFTPITGDLTEKQIEFSKELKDMFPAYVNSLMLRDKTGKKLMLEDDGSGSFSELVCDYLLQSAQQEIDTHNTRENLSFCAIPGSQVETHPAFTFDNGKVKAVALQDYAKAITRMKVTPAFDALDLSSAENIEFGTENIDAQHFSEFSMVHSEVVATKADERIIRMMNPINYIIEAQANTTNNWRIRHGSYDRDTSLAIPVILAIMLENSGKNVDFSLPWGIPHRGDYDLEELFQWIDQICKAQGGSHEFN